MLKNIRNLAFSPLPNNAGFVSQKDVLSWYEIAEKLEEIPSISREECGKHMALWLGDITKIEGPNLAIVNAANITLRKGGGVNGIIHRASGPELEQECRLILLKRTEPLKVTECVCTDAYELPCDKVIHCITPSQNQPEELYQTYIKACTEATENKLQAICIPALSTGSHFFDPETAADLAVSAGFDFLLERETLLNASAKDVDDTVGLDFKIIYCCLDETMLEFYKSAFIKVFTDS
mmetsp:Transcript_6546/g.8315  ORF Transcript_6546/g.8315 Transcript_6546/m.8315 type:complete len:237 (+) Transcript_6546:148-858(+)|eukprot:CAMPEP_0204821984 /NCGR_PEP_ID=MMETSP1346-20131115/168_1 /ASSEMBLY_ACC=CAM_ASM_000771 /TAXON_ID=215587 /ORGANISM="Aplanochytrium stocchinoi, Strain GSBS06" /LENGTH=236 /DNA_ID=CAMNT_0051947979 /DNA_START=64 /DNA_END=774 /DNA_ORIENTATION=+